jgi:predicted protein tyrosine phosphatase
MTNRINALWNCKNPNQGKMKKILCVCSAGLLRSPSLAHYLACNGYNTRAAGVYDYALIRVDDVLMLWADNVICVEEEHKKVLQYIYPNATNIISLSIPDQYEIRSPELMHIIEEQCKELKLT